MNHHPQSGSSPKIGIARPDRVSFKPKVQQSIYIIIRWILGLVFLVFGISKCLNPVEFSIIIESYGIVPLNLALPAAVGLSLLEVIAGAGLLLDIRWSLSMITGLLLLFIGVLGYGLVLGLDVDCGCFSVDDPEGRAFHGLRPALYRDIAMLFGVGCLIYWRNAFGFTPKRFADVLSMIKPGRN